MVAIIFIENNSLLPDSICSDVERLKGQLFSLKIIRFYRPLRNGYALPVTKGGETN
jgi:hypothetical protein